ncbi:MAG: sodium ion-translocating decarboxylase subunit beta [Opitutales bacterium]
MEFLEQSGFARISLGNVAMWLIVIALLYLGIAKKFEPLLLVPIAAGALLANLGTLIEEPPPDPQRLLAEVAGTVIEIRVDENDVLTNADADRRAIVIRTNQRDDDGEFILEEIEMGDIGAGKVTDLYVREGQTVTKDDLLVRLQPEGRGGLFYYFKKGLDLELFPPLIFLGVGALTDFGPLIANPRTLLLGAAAQFGVFATFLGGLFIFSTSEEAAAVSIIGGADGPTSILLANNLAPHLVGPIAVAAYSYMALVPLIQPPIMRGLTTEKERRIRMTSLRKVGKLEKLIFGGVVTVFCILMVPESAPLIGMLMLGNLLKESGVTERLTRSAQNEIINVVTILLGASVGITMTAERFLTMETLGILALGIVAFGIATASGVLMARLMNLLSPGSPINPLIGSAGVSAVPMAARVSQVEGQKADPQNHLLMHAMGPNVAGVIGTAVAAGIFISYFG